MHKHMTNTILYTVIYNDNIGKETGETGNQRENCIHTDHSIIKISWNTRKSSGDLRRIVTHTLIKTSVKNLQGVK